MPVPARPGRDEVQAIAGLKPAAAPKLEPAMSLLDEQLGKATPEQIERAENLRPRLLRKPY